MSSSPFRNGRAGRILKGSKDLALTSVFVAVGGAPGASRGTSAPGGYLVQGVVGPPANLDVAVSTSRRWEGTWR